MKLTDARDIFFELAGGVVIVAFMVVGVPLYALGEKIMKSTKGVRCSLFHWRLTGTGKVYKIGYAEHLEECPKCGVVWGPMT